MAEFTAKPSVLTDYLLTLTRARQEELGLRRVYYGDQTYLPEVPALCIEPAVLVREMAGVPLRTLNQFNVSLLLYAANIEGVEDAQHSADTFAEAIVDVINQDGLPTHQGGTNFNGLVIYGYVQSSEYGYVVKDNKLMRANRMIVFAQNKTNLLEA